MLFIGDLCFSALNRCFSYCLLSFACLDGLFYLICLSLPLITHFLYFFDVFLYALRVACLFFALLAGFCTAWRLVLRNMSFFAVDCSFFLYALRVACLFFALLAVGSRVLTLFFPVCLMQN